uniref:Uncharacterized protein n=1 Tax=Ixodes ricinus TaxID=34613 RepID=A0A6B0UKT2_IXORI
MCALLGRGLLCFSFLSPCARRATLEPNCVVRKKKRAPLYAFFFSLFRGFFFLPSFASCVALLRRGLHRFSFLSSCATRAARDQPALKKIFFFVFFGSVDFFFRLSQVVLFRFA